MGFGSKEYDKYKAPGFRPQTEEEYWEMLDSYGYNIFWMSHNCGEDAKETRKALQNLREEACERFNLHVQMPGSEVIPEGKTSYKEWFCKMKSEILQRAYEELICSSCPYSKSLEMYIDRQYIPCSLDGVMKDLDIPGILKCTRVHFNQLFEDTLGPLTHHDLIEKIRSEHGDEIADRMAARLKEALEEERHLAMSNFIDEM